MTPVLIDKPEDLASHAARWSRAPWIALDTEFVRVDTYYPKLCLIQVTDGSESVCLDVLALPDLQPLFDVVDRPEIICVLHAASQDLEILVQHNDRLPATLFDTQIAATLLGIGDQIGYAGLVEKRLGLTVDKSLSRTDWSRRPLADKEIAYAADDVRHLAEIYPALRDELSQRGRLAWLQEDCARLNDPTLYCTHPEDAWQRLKGLQRLAPAEQTIAARLAAWRETEAQQRDRPRKWIIEDEPIYRMAQRAPENMEQLEGLKVLPPRTLERRGKALLAVIAEARSAAPQNLAHNEELSPAQTALIKKLQAAAQARALELGIPASFLVSRGDLGRLLRDRDQADIALLKGWRREFAGEELLKLVGGA
jgi:ribonuclease D